MSSPSNVSLPLNLIPIPQSAGEDEDDFDHEECWARGGPQGANQVSLNLKYLYVQVRSYVPQNVCY